MSTKIHLHTELQLSNWNDYAMRCDQETKILANFTTVFKNRTTTSCCGISAICELTSISRSTANRQLIDESFCCKSYAWYSEHLPAFFFNNCTRMICIVPTLHNWLRHELEHVRLNRILIEDPVKCEHWLLLFVVLQWINSHSSGVWIWVCPMRVAVSNVHLRVISLFQATCRLIDGRRFSGH